MTMARSLTQQLKTKHKQLRALELRAHGDTYQEIARKVGYSNAGAAYKAVRRALAQVDYEAAVELRQIQLLRLDEMLEMVWPTATDETHTNQMRAVGQVLDIIDKINDLTGIGR